MPTRRASTGVRYVERPGRGNTSRWTTRFPVGGGRGSGGAGGRQP